MAPEVKVFAIPNDLSLVPISHKGEKPTSESFPFTPDLHTLMPDLHTCYTNAHTHTHQ